MKTKCEKCDKQVKAKSGRSKRVQISLLILGFLTLGIGWIALLIYRLFKPKYICPNCGKKLKTAS